MTTLQRRTFLRWSATLAATGLAMTPGGGERSARATAPPPAVRGRARAMVLLFMHGGMSQIDTFDPKPGRVTGGVFRAIDTAQPGVRFAEHLPKLAARAEHLTVLRSLVGKEGNHQRARYLMHTGFSPQGGVVHPSLGAHVGRACDGRRDVPGHVSIGRDAHGAGYLGPGHAPFIVPNAAQPVRNLAPPMALPSERVVRRRALVAALDRRFAGSHDAPGAVAGAAMRAQAEAIMAGPAAAAFDLSAERPDTLARYGDAGFGRGCLMARRLVEAGVPFVEVVLPGWDTHQDNFARVEARSRELDRAMSALLDDLGASGRDADTVVACVTDFGRTPTINGRGGRDHYPAVSSALLFGGGLARGRVVGATDPDGRAVVTAPVSVGDLVRTLAEQLGVEPDEVHMTPEGRPVTTMDPAARRVTDLLA